MLCKATVMPAGSMERATFLGGNAGIFALRSRTSVVKGRVFECGDDVRTTTVVRPDSEERARPKNHANCLLKWVEAIGRNSNFAHLSRKWSDLRERIAASQPRPPLSAKDAPKLRSKRFLNTQDVADIVAWYETGDHAADRHSLRDMPNIEPTTNGFAISGS